MGTQALEIPRYNPILQETKITWTSQENEDLIREDMTEGLPELPFLQLPKGRVLALRTGIDEQFVPSYEGIAFILNEH